MAFLRSTIFAVVLTSVTFGPRPAYACVFHNYDPQLTLVDQLLDSQQIVLAQPALADPLRYEAFSAVKGRLGGVEIPQRVDVATLNQFIQSEGGYVLFARKAYGPWRKLAFADRAFLTVLNEILAHLPKWEAGSGSARLRFFASKLNHRDIRVRRMAMRELDRVVASLHRSAGLRREPPRNHVNSFAGLKRSDTSPVAQISFFKSNLAIGAPSSRLSLCRSIQTTVGFCVNSK